MSLENLTTYTQVAPLTGITISANSIVTNPTVAIGGYLYYDYNLGAFTDFDHSFSLSVTSVGATPPAGDYIYPWAISNQLPITTECAFVKLTNARVLSFGFIVGGVTTSTNVATLTLATTYYIRITLDSTISTYGSLRIYVYSDALYMNLLYSSTIDLTFALSYRYIYGFAISNASAYTFKTTISNLSIAAYRLSVDMILNKVYSIVGEKSLRNFTREELIRYLNDAERELAITAGCIQKISSATTVGASDSVAYTSAYKTKYIEKSGYSLMPQTFQQVGWLPASLKNPYYWFNLDSAIKLDPIPTGADTLTLYTCNEPAQEMSYRYDIANCPPEYRDVLYLFLLSRIFHKLGNIGIESFFMNMFYNMIAFLMPMTTDIAADPTDSMKWPDTEVTEQQ